MVIVNAHEQYSNAGTKGKMAAPKGVSLVSNILKKAATFDEVYLEESLSKIEKKCSDLKEEILQFLKQNYDEFMVQAESTISTEQKLQELINEFQRVSNRVESDLKGRLSKGIGKKEEIEKQFKETEAKIKFVEKLAQTHTRLEQISQDSSRKRYMAASRAINETTNLLNQIGEDGCDAKVFHSLKNQLAAVKSDLKYQLAEEWNRFVKWSPSVPIQESNMSNALDIAHTIPNEVVPEFVEVNKSMVNIFSDSEEEGRLKRYANRLLDAFIKPLLKNPSLQIVIATDSSNSTVVISLADIGCKRSVDSCANSLVTLVTVIHDMIPESLREKWMSLLGQTIEPDLTPLFIKHVLSERTPKTSTERNEYLTTSSLIKKVQGKLQSLHIVSESYSALTDYTVNVDSHIAVQQCNDILHQARSLLLQPLHNTIKTTHKDTAIPLQKLNIGGSFVVGEKQYRLASTVDQLDISSLSFAFPSCLISESVKQLVSILYNTLIRCTTSSSNTTIQLYRTARDIVELFIAISNAYHQETVSVIPRNAMVQHNNFMFVAHNLLTIGHQFHSHIKCIDSVSFIDYVPRLRKLGEDCFLSEMEKQSNSILECLSGFKSFDEVCTRQDELQRAIRQAILLVFNLSKVYSETLHTELYRRCQGGLLNVLIAELISRTLSLVDIASADANALNEAFEIEVIQKSPVALSLISIEEEYELSEICPNWEKLKEIVFILGAGQNDIVNRWANGKGPLGKHLTVAEVKQLIRAIFKNTERRAETLSKIT